MPVAAPSAEATADEDKKESSATVRTDADNEVAALVEKHCTSCHASEPTDDIFKVAPLGVKFDNWADIKRYAPQIYQRAAVTKDMPFLNKTGMTEEERQAIASWYQQR